MVTHFPVYLFYPFSSCHFKSFPVAFITGTEYEQRIKEELHGGRHCKFGIRGLPENPGRIPVSVRACVLLHDGRTGTVPGVARNGRGHHGKSGCHYTDSYTECVVRKATAGVPGSDTCHEE